MEKSLRKPILLTILLIIALVIILIIIANGKPGNNQGLLNIFSIVIILALIALVWFRYVQEKNLGSKELANPLMNTNLQPSREESQPSVELDKESPVPISKEEPSGPDSQEEVSNRTGQTCEISGHYVCPEHPDHGVDMEEGKRFPPCRGDGSGHSALWVLRGEQVVVEENLLSTKTGATCVKSGVYACSEHPDKTVEMLEGKRFPPCRGDGNGHSAIWVLQE